MVIINKRTVDYISEYYLTAGEKEQEEILIDWDEFLAGVELVGKEYKSIFTQISTDIMRVMCGKYLPDMYFIIMDFSLDMVLMKMVNLKLGHIKE